MITHVPELPVPTYPRGNRAGGLRSLSASQMDDWNKCARYWHIRTVQGLREPPTPEMSLGTDLHAAFENRVKTGVLPPAEHPVHGKKFAKMHAAHWEGFEKHVLRGRPQDLVRTVERRFSMPTWNGGPPWNGVIDLPVEDEQPRPLVVDHKSTSDFRYVKTPHELSETPQMASYAWWALHNAGPYAKHAELYEENRHAGYSRAVDDAVDVAHLYIRTKGAPETHYVPVTMPYETTRHTWTRLLTIGRQMEAASHAASEQDLPPNEGSCASPLLGKGGCPYRSRCGFAPSMKETFTMPLPPPPPPAPGAPTALSQSAPLTPLAAKLAAAAAARGIPTAPPAAPRAPAPPPPPAAAAPPAPPAPVVAAPTAASVPVPPPGQVVPPDAPPRDQREDPEFLAAQADAEAARIAAERAEREAEAAKEAAKQAKAEAAAAKKAAKVKPAPPPAPAPVVAAPPVEVEAPAVVAPPAPPVEAPPVAAAPSTRGFVILVDVYPTKGDFGRVMLLADFLAPLTAEVARRAGVADYRLIPFAGWKASLAMLLAAGNYDIPDTLVVSSYTTGANEVLEALTPFATAVLQKI